MLLNILGKDYNFIDAKEKVTIADSFVKPKNKIWTWHWEAKLYVWDKGWSSEKWLREFFWAEWFSLKCFLLKIDLLKYMEDTKIEYLHPEQQYKAKQDLPNLWQKRLNMINSLPDIIFFEVQEQVNVGWPRRVYVNSSDKTYQIIRELSLPNITYISIAKIEDEHLNILYYFRLFADFFWKECPEFEIDEEEQKIMEENIDENEKIEIKKARNWQWKYREQLLGECPFCPITWISDDRLLIASHIKPWAKSNTFEKTDPKNWFTLSPMFDCLFDRWFMTFSDDKKVILSPFLSNMTYSLIWISPNKKIYQLPIEGRLEYLKYHRENIFKWPSSL